jgi:hypothetical protein
VALLAQADACQDGAASLCCSCKVLPQSAQRVLKRVADWDMELLLPVLTSKICSLTQSYMPSQESRHMLDFSGMNLPV